MVRGLLLTSAGELEVREVTLAPLESGDALVRVAGCGLCHTDISFYTGAVRPRHPLPLVLGHEIAGTVEQAPAPFEHLTGRAVVVPAVIPCGQCDLCRAGRDNACLAQVMPGNDTHGGFATHTVVPARCLIPLPSDLAGHALAELSVVADAVTTPYQALLRAGVAPGDLVIVIGVGGIGVFAVQIAQSMGAIVACIDVDPMKLARASDFGCRWYFNPRESDGRAIKNRLLAEGDISPARWRILEMSGTAAGQELAWTLLPTAGTLGIVGFTMDKPSIRLSNLMALDATAFGSWGCSPRHYPAVLDLVLSGRVQIRPFIESRSLIEGPELFSALSASHNGGPSRRAILIPE